MIVEMEDDHYEKPENIKRYLLAWIRKSFISLSLQLPERCLHSG